MTTQPNDTEGKKYVAQRPLDAALGDCKVFVVENGRPEPLHHVVYHSPNGFEWGYGGSGPADLALSILADYFGEKPTKTQLYRGHCRCWQHHQDFKWVFIAAAGTQGFTITEKQIENWLKEQ